MAKKISIIALTICLVFVFSAVNALQVAALNPTPDDPLTLRVGYADSATWPNGADLPEPEHGQALVFKQFVESETNGAILVELFPSSQLASAREMVEMTQTGVLDISITTGMMGPFFPEFQLINIPWVFEDSEIAYWVFENSEYWAELMDRMEEETDLKYLGMGQNGVRHLTNDVRPIQTPEDMEGLSFRVMESPIYVEMIEALGGEATPIAWDELYTALSTGVIDGQENPLTIIRYVGNLHEVQEYLTLTGHVWSEDLMVMNAPRFNDLPEDMQHIIERAGRLGARAGQSSEELSTRILAYDDLVDHMEIYNPTPEEIEMFREKAQPPVVEWLKGEIGEEPVERFLEAVEEAEEELGY